jgi:hypothetical protein
MSTDANSGRVAVITGASSGHRRGDRPRAGRRRPPLSGVGHRLPRLTAARPRMPIPGHVPVDNPNDVQLSTTRRGGFSGRLLRRKRERTAGAQGRRFGARVVSGHRRSDNGVTHSDDACVVETSERTYCALRTLAREEDQSPAGARSEPVPLPHPSQGSSDAQTAPIHATGERAAAIAVADHGASETPARPSAGIKKRRPGCRGRAARRPHTAVAVSGTPGVARE